MSNYDILLMSVKNIFRNKLKFILTMISICIGITSIMIITTVSDIGKKIIDDELDSMGIDGLSISNKYSDIESVLSLEVISSIENNFEQIDYVMPILSDMGTYSSSTSEGQAVIFGVDNTLYDTLKVKSLYGKCFSQNDVEYARNVCIIDENLANTLYKRSNIIGKEISLNLNGNKEYFEIIGVISDQKALVDSVMGENSPSFIYIPYTVALDMANEKNLSQIAIRASADADLNELKEDLEYFTSKKRDLEDKIDVQNISSYMESISNVTLIVGLLLGFVASISLVVASIGVSNIMFSSAVERKKEIGIYMALGAKANTISKIFLAESVLICLFSGVIGVIIGVISIFTVSQIINVEFYINVKYIIIVFAISILCGIISGIAPAIKASKLNPIDVLRE